MIVSATDIQNSFGKYLQLAQNETVIITKNGKKIARLVAYRDNENNGRSCVSEGSLSYLPDGVRITYEEYLKLVEESENCYEFIDGQIFLLTAPLYPHQKAVKELFLQFGQWFRNKKCEPLVSPFDVTLYRLGNTEKVNVVQPDILVICDPENISNKGKYSGVPTLVAEVLSDASQRMDLINKLDLYMESGIKEYWIVNPASAEIYIYVFANNMIKTIATFKGADLAASAVFPGLRVDLKQVFPQ
jgi:prevent-host-death family protein